jgi:hypothetical protein
MRERQVGERCGLVWLVSGGIELRFGGASWKKAEMTVRQGSEKNLIRCVIGDWSGPALRFQSRKNKEVIAVVISI